MAEVQAPCTSEKRVPGSGEILGICICSHLPQPPAGQGSPEISGYRGKLLKIPNRYYHIKYHGLLIVFFSQPCC